MSGLKSRVGQWNLTWKSVPRGRSGVAQVEVEKGKTLEIRWKRDSDGLWILLPTGTYGYDLQGEKDDEGRLKYLVSQRNFHMEWAGIHASVGAEEAQAVNRGNKAKAVRVRAQMPGKIIRITAEVGQTVEKNQSMMVMEAMKMENEIRAPQAGKISQIKVTEGQAIETGADLILIESS